MSPIDPVQPLRWWQVALGSLLFAGATFAVLVAGFVLLG
jgi:hypothetical protein